MRILIVEDDAQLAEVLARGLDEEGLTTDTLADGRDAIEAARQTQFDVISLDLMLPGLDGLQVCAALRSAGVSTPILMLTARDGVQDRVRGLGSGADDYLVKPFEFAEYLARLRALARRHLPHRQSLLKVGPIELDVDDRTVQVDGRPVELTAKELTILEYFMHHPGRVLSRAQVEEHAWDYSFESGSNLVHVYMNRLRRKLSEAGAGDPIETLRGIGYRLTDTP